MFRQGGGSGGGGGNSTARKLYDYCAELRFEYAIDGKITSLSLDEFQAKRQQVQRVVETVTLLNDPNYTGGMEQEVEVAFRITGCAQTHAFKITHVYWA